jgi:Flp pilus assembly protein TadG
MRIVHSISVRARPGQKDQGTAIIEIVLVMPVLVLCLLVAIDLGLALREHQVLQNAAREAARFSALPGNQVSPLNPNATLTYIQQRAVDYCQREKVTISASDVAVDQAYTIPIGGTVTSVAGSHISIVHRHSLLIGVPYFGAGTLTLRAGAVFRNLY